MKELSTAFDTRSQLVSDLMTRANVGFYIPLYQREYSWDKDNIDQLMEDIFHGVEHLLEDDDEIRFLGTIIRVKESNENKNIQPIDPRALPDTIFNIIDGQQRISTITLLSCLLYEKIAILQQKLPQDGIYEAMHEELDSKLNALRKVFSVDIERGKPNIKPTIIRGSIDYWTLNGGDEEHYRSDVSNYIAKFIRAIHDKTTYPSSPKKNRVGRNLTIMKRDWLSKVENAHKNPDSDTTFPLAWDILKNLDERFIWSYPRPDFSNLIMDQQNSPNDQFDTLCSIVQLSVFTYYLLHRCCFTTIDPISENWAFDMFQSLNATGTPLTAIETFKPLVVNTAESFKGSDEEKFFNQIDALFAAESTAAKKSRLTNDFLITLALAHDGTKKRKMSRQFSQQRRWLTETYGDYKSHEKQVEFVQCMGELASYYKTIQYFNHDETPFFTELSKPLSKQDKELATLCTLYLYDSSHKMAHTLLGHFYSNVVRECIGASQEFAEASKALAAFYTLWRSAVSNTGLDNEYRQILRGNTQLGIQGMSWVSNQSDFTSSNLKKYLRQALERRDLGNKQEWSAKAHAYYRADHARSVCRFGMIVTANDTKADEHTPGLMKVGIDASSRNYLTPEIWRASELKTVEHIAPEKNNGDWDQRLYDSDDYQKIGNLTLLPANVNTSASNKGWRAKWIYYKHLAETDSGEVENLQALASKNDIELRTKTVELLTSQSHKHHIIPLVLLGIDGTWNYDFVQKRTERICSLLWERLYPWLCD